MSVLDSDLRGVKNSPFSAIVCGVQGMSFCTDLYELKYNAFRLWKVAHRLDHAREYAHTGLFADWFSGKTSRWSCLALWWRWTEVYTEWDRVACFCCFIAYYWPTGSSLCLSFLSAYHAYGVCSTRKQGYGRTTIFQEFGTWCCCHLVYDGNWFFWFGSALHADNIGKSNGMFSKPRLTSF